MGDPRTMGSIIEKYYDNSLDNIGDKTSFVWYGPRWTSAGTAPSRGTKGYSTEGGIHCPCIIRFPPLMSGGGAGGEEGGLISHAFTTVMDILPTVLDLSDVKHPGSKYRGREVALPRGKSWVPHLSSPNVETPVHDEENHIYGWELFGERAIRQGKWKAVWSIKPCSASKDGRELYNVEDDPCEMDDCAEGYPEILDRLVEFWDQYVSETGMIPTSMFDKQLRSAVAKYID